MYTTLTNTLQDIPNKTVIELIRMKNTWTINECYTLNLKVASSALTMLMDVAEHQRERYVLRINSHFKIIRGGVFKFLVGFIRILQFLWYFHPKSVIILCTMGILKSFAVITKTLCTKRNLNGLKKKIPSFIRKKLASRGKNITVRNKIYGKIIRIRKLWHDILPRNENL